LKGEGSAQNQQGVDVILDAPIIIARSLIVRDASHVCQSCGWKSPERFFDRSFVLKIT